MKIDESKLPKLLKLVSFLSLLFVFTTFFCVLILEFNMVDRWKYPIDYFVGLFVFLNFAIGCVGASVLFSNLSAARSLRAVSLYLLATSGYSTVRLRCTKFQLCTL
jgi:hypothetical protein